MSHPSASSWSLAWQIARRFRQKKHDQRFVSFISAASIVGISLGCAVLILLLSVMNGFERELEGRILSVIPHGEIFAVDPAGLHSLNEGLNTIAQQPFVKSVYPYSQQSALLQVKDALHGLSITGLDVNHVTHPLWDFVELYNVAPPSPESPEIYLGKGVIDKFSLLPGQAVSMLLPVQENHSANNGGLNFKSPTRLTGYLAGEINVGGEPDLLLGLTRLDALNNVIGVTKGAKGLQIYYNDVFAASNFTYQIGYEYPEAVYISDWTRTHGHLYQDIQLVKIIVYIVLILVIAVASFNILSSLTMAVKNKQSQIAILKTMGASPLFLSRIFMLQGLFNAGIGIISGTSLGIIFSVYLAQIIRFFEGLLGVAMLSGDIYFIDFLPTELHLIDVLLTVFIALGLSMIATVYPAKKAANLVAAEFLH
ncbi:MAG: Lipoprotein-releasing system transmembrane protein LolE [Glaciecola sp. HTCC2999]|nr:MAG: Lipoprotein-releasing system transmembrane protein LolE [Glaciecola sp. HTCC2999]